MRGTGRAAEIALDPGEDAEAAGVATAGAVVAAVMGKAVFDWRVGDACIEVGKDVGAVVPGADVWTLASFLSSFYEFVGKVSQTNISNRRIPRRERRDQKRDYSPVSSCPPSPVPIRELRYLYSTRKGKRSAEMSE